MRQIEVFRLVMLTGSITDAARSLSVSQPGITRMVRYIESRLGVALFLRRKGKLVPTAEARALYREVERVYHGVQAVQAVAAALKQGAGTPLRVLSSPNMAMRLVPRALARLAQEYPAIHLSIEVVPAAEMAARLVAGSAEIGIASAAVEHPFLDVAPIGSWQLVCVMKPGHALANCDQPTVEAILAHPLVAFAADTVQGAVLRQWLAERDREPNMAVEVRAGQLACALVEAGFGIALVDDITAGNARSDGLLTRPIPESPSFPIVALTSTEEPPPRAALRLRELVRAELDAASGGAHAPR